MSVDYVDDWYKRLKGHIYEQFKGKTKVDQWVRLMAAQAQDLEDAAQSLLTITNIDDSSGVQLDNLGRLVGQPRVGDDETYRLYLRARIVANKSNGTGENLYRVFSALFPSTLPKQFTIVNGGNKSFVFRFNYPLYVVQDQLAAATFFHDAKEAGARAIMEFQQAEDNPGIPEINIMRWDVVGHGFDQAIWGGATQV